MTPPSAKTLAKYGLTADDWLALLARQGGYCAVCQEPRDRLCVDHEHVKGWKKMPPDRRRAHVRALLCFFCNLHYAGRGISEARARRVTAMLVEYKAGEPLAAMNRRGA